METPTERAWSWRKLKHASVYIQDNKDQKPTVVDEIQETEVDKVVGHGQKLWILCFSKGCTRLMDFSLSPE